MIRRPPRSTLFPTRRSSDLTTGTGAVNVTDSAGNTYTIDRDQNDGSQGDRVLLFSARNVRPLPAGGTISRSEEHTSELQSLTNLVCRLLLEKKKHKQKLIHQ